MLDDDVSLKSKHVASNATAQNSGLVDGLHFILAARMAQRHAIVKDLTSKTVTCNKNRVCSV
jgi:hypothetical protein